MRPALEVADIFRRHGDAFRAAQGGRLLPDQRRVMAAIAACRTATLGGHVERCDDCGMVRVAYNSCRDRHCPKCQGLARAEWLADRQADLLPVPYFHVVFTVPAPIAAIALQNKAVVYDILLKAAAETIRLITADPKHLGGATGLIAILHVSCQAAASLPTDDGSAASRASSSPSGFCRDCIGGCSWNDCRPLLTKRSWHSSAISPISRTQRSSPNISARCATSNGTSMRSGPLAGRSRSWNIWAVTPIVSQSPTAGSSPARTATFASAGRIIAPTTSPR
jgi:hypothetical protein